MQAHYDDLKAEHDEAQRQLAERGAELAAERKEARAAADQVGLAGRRTGWPGTASGSGLRPWRAAKQGSPQAAGLAAMQAAHLAVPQPLWHPLLPPGPSWGSCRGRRPGCRSCRRSWSRRSRSCRWACVGAGWEGGTGAAALELCWRSSPQLARCLTWLHPLLQEVHRLRGDTQAAFKLLVETVREKEAAVEALEGQADALRSEAEAARRARDAAAASLQVRAECCRFGSGVGSP